LSGNILDIILKINSLVLDNDVLGAYELVREVSRNGYEPQEKERVIARFGVVLTDIYGPARANELLEALYGGKYIRIQRILASNKG